MWMIDTQRMLPGRESRNREMADVCHPYQRTGKERLIELADKILLTWRGYTDEDAFIYAETDGEPHNTITPIARRRGDDFELDLVLRNNITTGEYPLGVYHPHAKLHHIKKENLVCQFNQTLLVRSADTDDRHRPFHDSCFHIGKSLKLKFFFNRCFCHGKCIMSALEMIMT